MISAHQFAQQIKLLAALRGQHTGFISVYIPPARKIHEVIGYLRQEIANSKSIQDKVNRKEVFSGLLRIID